MVESASMTPASVEFRICATAQMCELCVECGNRLREAELSFLSA